MEFVDVRVVTEPNYQKNVRCITQGALKENNIASIFLRGRVYWIWYYDKGRKISYSLKTRDKTFAKFKKNEIENRLALGDSSLPLANVNAMDALNEYTEYCRGHVTPKTLQNYKSYLNTFLIKEKIFSVETINESHVQNFIKSKSDVTAHHIIRYIISFLNFCVSKKYVKENPVKNIRRPKLEQTKHRFLSKDEIQLIINQAPKFGLKEYVIFAVYTGMRPSELKRLEWKDIDLESNTIIIQKSKTKKARAIPIHPEIIKIEFKKTGKIFDLTNLRKRFKELKDLTNIQDIDLYTFRHTFASQLVIAGTDIGTVARLMGHARITTTQIYMHLSDDHIQQAIMKLKF